MFELDIDLIEPNVQKAHYSSMNMDNILECLSTEGHLSIIQNGQIVFSEDVAVIELYWYISRWYKAGSIKQRLSFIYATIEYIEPILSFSYYKEGQWKVNSPWMKNGTSVIVEEHVLESQVQKIICFLANKLEL